MIVLIQSGYDCGPLLLTQVKRDSSGAIKRAYVVNGDWVLKRIGNGFQSWAVGATRADGPESGWPVPELREVAIPESMRRDHYNDVVDWALAQPKPVKRRTYVAMGRAVVVDA